MEKKHNIFKSFEFALAGIGFAVSNNRNMQIHIIAAVLALIMSWYFKIGRAEFLAIMIMIILVMSAEMINTAIEEMTNLITSEHRREARIAKDVSAGMVLILSIGALIVGIYVFLPHILMLFNA